MLSNKLFKPFPMFKTLLLVINKFIYANNTLFFDFIVLYNYKYLQ